MTGEPECWSSRPTVVDPTRLGERAVRDGRVLCFHDEFEHRGDPDVVHWRAQREEVAELDRLDGASLRADYPVAVLGLANGAPAAGWRDLVSC